MRGEHELEMSKIVHKFKNEHEEAVEKVKQTITEDFKKEKDAMQKNYEAIIEVKSMYNSIIH